jgi:hypothetical protein
MQASKKFNKEGRKRLPRMRGRWSLVLVLAHGGVACGGVERSNGGPWWDIAFQGWERG